MSNSPKTKNMKTTTMYLCLILLCVNFTMQAQEKDSIQLKKEQDKRYLKERLLVIETQEKRILKSEIERINKDLEKGKIDKKEAEKQKKKAAMLAAATIEFRLAKAKREMLTDYYIQEGGSFIRFGEVFDTRKIRKRAARYDRRTYLDIVAGFGFANTLQDGQSLSNSDYKFNVVGHSEIGFTFRTRVFKNTNILRFKYGLSFNVQSLQPTGNRYFVQNGNQTTLELHDFKLKKSQFRIPSITIPLYFEIGPYNKIEKGKYVRYNTRKKVKLGLGGYFGFNLKPTQVLRYEEFGTNVHKRIRGNYNVNAFTYGLGAYVGWDDLALFCKYDLSPIFKSPNAKQRNLSFGLRLDVF